MFIAADEIERHRRVVLGDDLPHDAQAIADVAADLALHVVQAKRCKLTFDPLLGCGFCAALRRLPPDDVTQAGDLEHDLLDAISGVVKLHQDIGDVLDRQHRYAAFQTAFLRECGPIINGNELVIHALVEDAITSS